MLILSVIQAYVPIAGCSDECIDEFNEQLEQTIDQCKSQKIIILMRDPNTKIGNERVGCIVGDHCLGTQNKRGERFVDWCGQNNQIITYTGLKFPIDACGPGDTLVIDRRTR